MQVVELYGRESYLGSFLEKNDHLIFHTFPYKQFIEEAFSCRYQLLSAVDNGGIKTIFPFVDVRSKIFGNRIISSAYIEYGGFAGDEKYVGPLLDFLSEQYKRSHDVLEIRGGIAQFDSLLAKHLIQKNFYQRFVLPLADEQTIWKNIQHAKRKAINKALKEVDVEDVPVAEIPQLYSLYCRNMRAFGSPPYSKRYFESFYKHLVAKGMAKVYGAYIHKKGEQKLVAALLGFCYGDRVHILIAVSDPRYQQHRPNDAMHWTFIRWACQNNYRWFDFGRVREGSGQFEYKQKWGPTVMDLPSYFMLWKSKEVPMVDPEKHKLVVNLWKKMPLPVTKLVGMPLRKGLGI
ncbi:GNAT family N-acetyltransferase [Candidatus Woesearchaeota archaeon]|nr:GNAT family N-acetyltransferase [Candidatus Woesearchaeota archaeon]